MQRAATLARKPPQAGQLLRVLGLAFAIAVGVGAVIGGGILRTPATVMDAVPVVAVALALWFAVGVHALLEANVVAEVTTAIPRSGGLFVPARAAFGEPGGLLVGWTDWLGWTAAAAALSVLSAEFLAMVVPGLANHVALTGSAILAAVTLLNWLGVREGSRAQILGSAAKTLFLIGIVVLIFVLPAGEPVADRPAAIAGPVTLVGIIVAYQTIYGSYAGWTSSAYFSEEQRDPGRDIPRGMFSTIVLVILLYTLVSAALSHALPIDSLRESKLPVADALIATVGPIGVKIVAAGALVIALTCLNAQMMGAPRILYGLAAERLFPAVALRVNRGGTPSFALLLTAAAALVLTLTGEFETVFLIMAALGLVPILAAVLAFFKLRRDSPDLPRPYRAKFHPWLPALTLVLDVAILVAFLASDWISGLFVIGAIAISVPIGMWMRRNQPEPIPLGS